ncbi:ketosamine-3-kinase-like [Branchiostoma floridae]|uniref:protein-ribulosamine 3-kinase n=2 Tax=Branchiostoma floridae TaxID=7739 RepID=A0A9J7LXK6_BRAFL|nr:ketosamine-3-kinase-like [Branchiostoma floridae]
MSLAPVRFKLLGRCLKKRSHALDTRRRVIHTSTMEDLLKRELNTTKLRPIGGGGGCINHGEGYETDQGKFFVKMNGDKGARVMFEGENASLEAIAATGAVTVPKPIKVLDDPRGRGAMLIMEHVDMGGLRSYADQLGEQMARLHLHNEEVAKKAAAGSSRVGHGGDAAPAYVSQFGFHTKTCCGAIPQDNTWSDDWVSFYATRKLKLQLDLVEKDYHDRETRDLWPQLERKLPKFFEGLKVSPSLLHGDLWGGNAAENDKGPVIFDPASFYGHHEYELAIASMFGGFGGRFFSAYHKLLPKAPGWEARHELYKLFHYLNHWNHFGSSYRGSSVSIMKSLLKEY